MRFTRLRISTLLAALALSLCVGCEGANLGNNARASLSSFVTGVVNGIITSAINGNN